ncbi:Universal stress protein A-like protein [Porphyridium purpureum]|uniref:Universal stress protein A-like protein n=1 Tax=Porphyridium purpureum TaxID=35688 RepID=A0A5J4YMI1_PORPP|nr:Universal stress protein A-like protein [Porphyridium purpureum]|eukprot:POR3413..scf295_9
MAPRKVLIAVDTSEASTYAFEWALKNFVRKAVPSDKGLTSASEGDHVVVLSVVHVPQIKLLSFGYFGAEGQWEKTLEHATKAAEQHLTDLRAKADTLGMQVSTESRPGDPRDVIIDYIHLIKADIVIVGAGGDSAGEGASLKKKLTVGSISDHVVHHSEVPVLVIRKCPPKWKGEFSGADLMGSGVP